MSGVKKMPETLKYEKTYLVIFDFNLCNRRSFH